MEREKMVQTGFRLPVELVERIDREVELSGEKLPGFSCTRADVVRQLLSWGLDRRDEERQRAKPRKRKAG
jgi:Arc/MetJ-type ribon-helix-helix transcriptional regulator